MAELYNKSHKRKGKGQKQIRPLLSKGPSYLRVAKELGITENEVITNIKLCQAKHKRTALINSTNWISKFFKPNNYKECDQKAKQQKVYDEHKNDCEEHEKVYNEHEELYDEHEKVYDEHEKVYDEHEKVYDEHEKVYDEHEKVYDEHEKVYDEDNKVKCDLCQRSFKNKHGINVHKFWIHRSRRKSKKFHTFGNELTNAYKKHVHIETVFPDNILHTFKESTAISIYRGIRNDILRTNPNVIQAVQQKKIVVADLEKLWSNVNINFLQLNTLNSRMSFISNQHKGPLQQQNGQHVYYITKATEASVTNQPNDSTLRQSKNVLTLVKKVIVMHPLLEDFENFVCKYGQNLTLESQKQPLIISEIKDSESDCNTEHVTPINKAESSACPKELNDTRSNYNQSIITEPSVINTRLRSSRLKNMVLNHSNSITTVKRCGRKKLGNDLSTSVNKDTAVNNTTQQKTFPEEHNNLQMSPNGSMANNTELLQIQHSVTHLEAENTKSVLPDSPNTQEPDINEHKIKDNEPTLSAQVLTSEQRVSSKKLKKKKSATQNDQRTGAKTDANKSFCTVSLKKKKCALKLGSRKRYSAKKKLFKIRTLIGRHKSHMWARIRKKHKKRRSRISSNMIVEDFINEKPRSVEKTARNDTELNSRTPVAVSTEKINNMKDLRIPLIRIDELPSQELMKLTRKSNCTENVGKEANKTELTGRKRTVKKCKKKMPRDKIQDEKKYTTTEETKCVTSGHTTNVSPDKNQMQIASTANEEVTKTLTAVLHIEGYSVGRNLKLKALREEDKLPYQVNKNAVNSVESATIVEADTTMKSGYVSIEAPKSNSKRRTKSALHAVKKKMKLNDYERFEMNNGTEENQYAKPEKLNGQIISTTKKNVCHICDKSFSCRKTLSEHMFFIHDASIDNSMDSNLLNSQGCESEFSEIVVENSEGIEECSDQQVEDITEEESETDEASCEYTAKLQNVSLKRSRKWRCKVCKENFGLLRNYLRHKYYSHNDETVVHICDNCTKVLTSVAMVNVHVCTKVTSWICRRCNLEFPNGMSLGRHNINRHLEVVGPHTCNTCDLNFLTNYMLERHRSKEHACVNNTGKTNATMMHNAYNMGASFDQYQLLNTKEFSLSRSFWLPKKEEVEDYISNSKRVSLKNNQCNCTMCDLICPNKLLMKLHLEKKHNISMDICQLCNDLFPIGKVTWHLIDRHIISDNVYLRQNEADSKINLDTMEDAQYDLSKILGLKRLVSIYSYEKFIPSAQNAQFNCHVCLRRFVSAQDYKCHYLKEHDTVCILCNVEFEDSMRAMDHRLNTHTSADAYLWAVQSIVTALIKLKQHNSVLSNLADKIREMRICTAEESAAGSRKKEHHDHFASTFKTEILEVTSEYKSVTLSMRVEREVTANAIEPNTNAVTNRHQAYTDCSSLSDNSTGNAIDVGTSEAYSLTTTQSVLTNNSVSVILVTEEDLLLYKDNIGELASKLCSSCTMYSEEYITTLLTQYMQNLQENINK